MRMRVWLSVLAVWIAALPAYGIDEYHRMGVNLGFTEDGHHLSLSYHYRVWEYVGVGGSIGYWTDGDVIIDLLDAWSYDPSDPYDYYYEYRKWEKNKDRHISLFIEPSVLLTSPKLRVGSCGLGLTATPSVRFATTRHNSAIYMENGKPHTVRYRCGNVSFGIRGGLTFYVGALSLTAGYIVQYGDLWRRYTSRKRYEHRPVQGFFLELGASF